MKVPDSSALIGLGRICLPLIALPDTLKGLDIGNIFVVPDADEPREAEGKPAFVILACLQLGISYFKDERWFKRHLFS